MSNLTKRKTIRFSPSDHRRYERIAEERGTSFGAVVRRLAASREIVPREEAQRLAEVREELRSIGRNLNQAVRHAHSQARNGRAIDAEALDAAITETRALLSDLKEREETEEEMP